MSLTNYETAIRTIVRTWDELAHALTGGSDPVGMWYGPGRVIRAGGSGATYAR